MSNFPSESGEKTVVNPEKESELVYALAIVEKSKGVFKKRLLSFYL
jgi:hypothetical protein